MQERAPIFESEENLESSEDRISYLERLQVAGKIDGEKWDPRTHWPELQKLRETRDAPPTEEEESRYNFLTRSLSKGEPLEESVRIEFVALQKKMDRRNQIK